MTQRARLRFVTSGFIRLCVAVLEKKVLLESLEFLNALCLHHTFCPCPAWRRQEPTEIQLPSCRSGVGVRESKRSLPEEDHHRNPDVTKKRPFFPKDCPISSESSLLVPVSTGGRTFPLPGVQILGSSAGKRPGCVKSEQHHPYLPHSHYGLRRHFWLPLMLAHSP